MNNLKAFCFHGNIKNIDKTLFKKNLGKSLQGTIIQQPWEVIIIQYNVTFELAFQCGKISPNAFFAPCENTNFAASFQFFLQFFRLRTRRWRRPWPSCCPPSSPAGGCWSPPALYPSATIVARLKLMCLLCCKLFREPNCANIPKILSTNLQADNLKL